MLSALSRILGYHHDEPDEETLGDLPANGELFEGDMIMDNRLRDAVLNKKRTAIDNTDMLWKNGVIYYVNEIKSKSFLCFHTWVRDID